MTIYITIMMFLRCSSYLGALPIRSCIVKDERAPPSRVRMAAVKPEFKIPDRVLKI